VEAGWNILLFAVVLSLVFMALGGIRRLIGYLLPLVMVVDTVLAGLWISVSGGPVSNYMPIYLLILASALMILPPRRAAVVVGCVLIIAVGTLYLDFAWRLPLVFDAGDINPFSRILEKSPLEFRREIYLHQGIRWIFFLAMITLLCFVLMRQVWSREEHLRAREKSLEQKRHFIQMGELTGRIAHGVNTPLGLISGNLELLMEETRKDSKAYKQLVQIDQYVQRAIHTVRDVLDYSRQSLSEIKPVSVPHVLQAAVQAIQPKLKEKEVKLIVDIDSNLPALMAYTEGLFQAHLNLLENALDSIDTGGLITLTAKFQYRQVRLSAADKRGEIKVVVRDTGRGIPSQDLKRIFEPFYSTKGFGKGTGLGLAIVKRVVEEHRGSIAVESRPGEGSCFTLLFPAEGLSAVGTNEKDTLGYNASELTGKDS
jgi:signal transduction histidine kinase